MYDLNQMVSPNGIAALYFELSVKDSDVTSALLHLFKPLLEKFQGPKLFCTNNELECDNIQETLSLCDCKDAKFYLLNDDSEKTTELKELEVDIAALCQQTGQQVLALTNTSKLNKLNHISKTVVYLADDQKLLENIFYFYHAYMRLENASFHAKTHLSIQLLNSWTKEAVKLSLSKEAIESQYRTVHQLMDSYLLSLMRKEAYGDLVRDLMTKAQGKLNNLHFSMSQKRDSLQKQAKLTNPIARLRLQKDIDLLNQKLNLVCKAINAIKPLKGKEDLDALKTILDDLYYDPILSCHLSSRWQVLFYLKKLLLPSYTRGKLRTIRTEVIAMIRETKRELAKTKLPNSALAVSE